MSSISSLNTLFSGTVVLPIPSYYNKYSLTSNIFTYFCIFRYSGRCCVDTWGLCIVDGCLLYWFICDDKFLSTKKKYRAVLNTTISSYKRMYWLHCFYKLFYNGKNTYCIVFGVSLFLPMKQNDSNISHTGRYSR